MYHILFYLQLTVLVMKCFSSTSLGSCDGFKGHSSWDAGPNNLPRPRRRPAYKHILAQGRGRTGRSSSRENASWNSDIGSKWIHFCVGDWKGQSRSFRQLHMRCKQQWQNHLPILHSFGGRLAKWTSLVLLYNNTLNFKQVNMNIVNRSCNNDFIRFSIWTFNRTSLLFKTFVRN